MDCTLLFYYKPGQLTKNVNVVMTFDAPTKSELSTDQNYVAWRVANLKSNPGSKANNRFVVDYKDRFGFGVGQLTNGNTVIPSSMIEMKPGQSTELTLSGSSPAWSDPSDGTGTLIRATNKTGLVQNMAFGTVSDVEGGFSIIEPAFMWKVGQNLSVEAKFRPILKMYVNLDCKKNDFLSADVASMTPIWTGNLATLAPLASFAFTETPQQGYAVTQIPSMLKMASNLAATAIPPTININYSCRLNWQLAIGLPVVAATFAAIAKICTDNGYTYTEVKNDQNSYRTIGISKSQQSADDLHRVMVNAVVKAIKQCHSLNAGAGAENSLTDDDIDRNWSITDELATNVSTDSDFGGEEDVIPEGTAAWYHLK
ncbi:hypothetical protein AAF712_000931 [Marasmius tenuissimus]|uniref:Uncharacterized protein n=1 Tax=Marasmius tenuissimus TaxID=585030 RepID=A0ABR3AEJ3_9AGAR